MTRTIRRSINGPLPDQAVGSSQAHQRAQGPIQIAKRQDIAGSGEPQTAVVTPASEGGSPSVVVVPKITTTVVSRGDSLWRISRAAYGTGMRYAVIFGANHDQIRNPNRIYPGQIFVVPKQAP
jgi:nucleoid-associated protein YgaU